MTKRITKIPFLSARQCLSWGRFDLDTPKAPITPELQWRFWTGNEIGKRARAFLGEGRHLPPGPHDVAVEASLEALDSNETDLLFEVTVTWRAFTARADAMRRTANGWEIIEVKSGKSSEKNAIKDDYLDDIAYTVFVAQASGLTVERATLVLIDHEYVMDVAPFFRAIDVTEDALNVADEFAADALTIEHALIGEPPPVPVLNFACRQCPYFADVCVGRDVPDPLFDIPRLSEKAFNLYREHERISRLPVGATFTDIQQRHVDTVRTGTPWTDRKGLDLLDQLVWPAYYLDFEAIGPALPWFAGQQAYDVVPFQYSVHVRSSINDDVVHHEYLATPSTDWRRALAESLLEVLGTSGSIVVYSSYEKTQLTNMARLFPDLKPAIDAVLSRLFDLEKVFRDGYVHPKFRGRTSIKKVLPVLTDETYADMEIGDGLNAAAVFALMQVGEYPPETHATHRERLLAYCKLDTYAMVRLHDEILRIYAELRARTHL